MKRASYARAWSIEQLLAWYADTCILTPISNLAMLSPRPGTVLWGAVVGADVILVTAQSAPGLVSLNVVGTSMRLRPVTSVTGGDDHQGRSLRYQGLQRFPDVAPELRTVG
jgi:hypothetical protein